MKKIVIEENGYVIADIPKNVFDELIESIDYKQIADKKKFNDHLAGNIENELDVTGLIPNSFYEYMANLANNFYASFPIGLNLPQEKSFDFFATWLNVQKKYEFNPNHSHAGDLSYVVWLQIPYDLEEELSLPNCINSFIRRNSVFSFTTNDIDHPIWVDKSYVGKVILFKSTLRHAVYPFYTSNDERISLSGNITTKWSKPKFAVA